MKWIFQFFTQDIRDVSLQEKVLSALLALVAIFLSINVSSLFIDASEHPIYIASLGASAVLIFTAPSSSFSQPWPLVGSHVICAFIGVACAQFVPVLPLAAALAVSLSVFFMYFFRCLHPPGGAVALSIILGGNETLELGYQYILSPVLLNVSILLLFALLINNLVSGRSYPSRSFAGTESHSKEMGIQTSLYNQDDLEAALADMDSFIDISRADLHRIYRLAVSHANQRRVGDVTCQNIMKPNEIRFEYGTELANAWDILHEKKLKGAAVVDSFNRVVGIVTIRDFVRGANIESQHQVYERIKQFLTRTEGQTSVKAEVVGQIMSESVIVMKQNQHIMLLVDIFAEYKFHHIPIVDERKYLVGMVTRSDVMNALAVLRS